MLASHEGVPQAPNTSAPRKFPFGELTLEAEVDQRLWFRIRDDAAPATPPPPHGDVGRRPCPGLGQSVAQGCYLGEARGAAKYPAVPKPALSPNRA